MGLCVWWVSVQASESYQDSWGEVERSLLYSGVLGEAPQSSF